MKPKKLIYLIIIMFSVFGYSQNLEKLKENNGFRKIKLNTNIKDYVDEEGYYEFVKKDSSSIEFFERHTSYDYIYASNDYNKLGSTQINYIFVRTLNDIIYDIFIVTEPNSDIFELLELAFGAPTKSSSYGGIITMEWVKDNISFTFFGALSHVYFQLHYIDKNLREKAWKKNSEEEKRNALKEF